MNSVATLPGLPGNQGRDPLQTIANSCLLFSMEIALLGQSCGPPLSSPQIRLCGVVLWWCGCVMWLCGVVVWCGCVVWFVWCGLCGVVAWCGCVVWFVWCGATKIPPGTKEVPKVWDQNTTTYKGGTKVLGPKDHRVQRRYQSFTIRYQSGTKLVPSDTHQVPSWYH